MGIVATGVIAVAAAARAETAGAGAASVAVVGGEGGGFPGFGGFRGGRWWWTTAAVAVAIAAAVDGTKNVAGTGALGRRVDVPSQKLRQLLTRIAIQRVFESLLRHTECACNIYLPAASLAVTMPSLSRS